MRIMKRKSLFSLYLVGWLVVCVACSPVPCDVELVAEPVPMTPDYTNVAIPYNIAPLNFILTGGADASRVSICGKQDSLVVSGAEKVCFSAGKWKEFLNKVKGETLTVKVVAKVNDRWLQYPSFTWYITPEPVDGYMSYRLIEPGYEVWNALQLRERNLENFDERVIADNNLVEGNCMNCHIYGKQDGNLSMLHLRGEKGGTILNRGGKLRKLVLKNDSMVSAAVYGDFHPSGRYAVFSSNIIIPGFHAEGNKRLEVYDTASGLAIADLEHNRMIVSGMTNQKKVLETFPTFSADGKWIYYCAAPLVALPDSLHQLKYSLCRIAFDATKGEWGNRVDTLWSANKYKGSVCFPKASPDGSRLLFTVADYGTFPIWHQETDLRMLDLRTGQIDALQVVNSDRSDTYHSWASNSRWFAFASKRGDGQYGRPYLAYIDSEGRVYKPFVLPQKDPEYYNNTLKSYNIPELSNTPVSFDAAAIKQVYEQAEAEVFK
ncbi:hypothetical protein [Bacteroides sp.]